MLEAHGMYTYKITVELLTKQKLLRTFLGSTNRHLGQITVVDPWL